MACPSGCSGACAPGCTGACSVQCSSCASQGSCYGGCKSCRGCTSCQGCGGCTSCKGCSGTCSGCSGTCKGTCKGGCSDGCSSGCQDTCLGLCNTSCDTTCATTCSKTAGVDLSLGLTSPINTEEIQQIADCILYEFARRPESELIPTEEMQNLAFEVSEKALPDDINIITTNLKTLQNDSYSTEVNQGKQINRATSRYLIDKILTINNLFVPIVQSPTLDL